MTTVRKMDQHFLRQAEALIPADVKMISGCEDFQTLADVSNACNKFNLLDPAGRSGGVSPNQSYC